MTQQSQYMIHDLIPMCKPLDRIKRRGWGDNQFLIAPHGRFDRFYFHDYIEQPPSIYSYDFKVDDLLASDWVKL